jgi:hypothetical protein
VCSPYINQMHSTPPQHQKWAPMFTDKQLRHDVYNRVRKMQAGRKARNHARGKAPRLGRTGKKKAAKNTPKRDRTPIKTGVNMRTRTHQHVCTPHALHTLTIHTYP